MPIFFGAAGWFKKPKPTEWLNAGLPYFATPNQLGPAPGSMPLN